MIDVLIEALAFPIGPSDVPVLLAMVLFNGVVLGVLFALPWVLRDFAKSETQKSNYAVLGCVLVPLLLFYCGFASGMAMFAGVTDDVLASLIFATWLIGALVALVIWRVARWIAARPKPPRPGPPPPQGEA